MIADEHLFRAYGGATVTIKGKVVGVNYSTMKWKIRAQVTILDEADFSPGGMWGARHAMPGYLPSVYRAGAYLQSEGKKRDLRYRYWHTISFTSDYEVGLLPSVKSMLPLLP